MPLTGVVESGYTQPYHPAHPLPSWRLAKALGRTAWALAQVNTGRAACSVLENWSSRLLSALNIDVHLASPLPANGQLWVCNHLSWLDPMICFHLRSSASLAKAEVAGYPVIGPSLRRMGLRFVQREVALSRAAALARLAADLRRGEEMLLFPEGTTTRGSDLAPLYEGGIRAAYRLGVTVLPLRLFCREAHYPWTGEDSLLPHLFFLARARHTRVLVHPGPVLRPDTFASEAAWVHAIEHHLSPNTQDLRGCA